MWELDRFWWKKTDKSRESEAIENEVLRINGKRPSYPQTSCGVVPCQVVSASHSQVKPMRGIWGNAVCLCPTLSKTIISYYNKYSPQILRVGCVLFFFRFSILLPDLSRWQRKWSDRCKCNLTLTSPQCLPSNNVRSSLLISLSPSLFFTSVLVSAEICVLNFEPLKSNLIFKRSIKPYPLILILFQLL